MINDIQMARFEELEKKASSAPISDSEIEEMANLEKLASEPQEAPTRTAEKPNIMSALGGAIKYGGRVLSNVPKDVGNLVSGASETLGAQGDVMTGKAFYEAIRGKEPRIISQAKGIAEQLPSMAKTGAGLAGLTNPMLALAQALGAPKIGREEGVKAVKKYTTDLPETFAEEPVTTIATLAPIGKGLGLGKGLVGKGVSSKTPGLLKNLREPVRITEMASQEVGKKWGTLSKEMGKDIAAIEKKYPNKKVNLSSKIDDIAELAEEEPAIKRMITKNKKLNDIVYGEASADLTISELVKIKNDLTGVMSEGKLSGATRRSVDVPKMEVVSDINQAILNNFEEYATASAKYGVDKTNLKLLRKLAKKDTALDFVQSGLGNQAVRRAAETILPKSIYKKIQQYAKLKEFGIPKTNIKLKALEKKSFGKGNLERERLETIKQKARDIIERNKSKEGLLKALGE